MSQGISNEEINNLIKPYSSNRFIVSCRKEFHAYKSKRFGNFVFCKVADFTPTQITEFINNWFAQVTVCTQQEREELANKLIAKLNDPNNKRIQELADTPLLLHLICLIFQAKQDLPTKRVELYKEGIDLLLERWNLFNDRFQVGVEELRRALRAIAAITFDRGKSSFEETEVLPLIENSPDRLSSIEVLSGLLVKKEWKKYSFSHQTFQEYLAAEYLSASSQGWRKLLLYVIEPGWREVFLLAVEMLPNTDAFLRLFKAGLNEDNNNLWWGSYVFDSQDNSNETKEAFNDSRVHLIKNLLIQVNQKLGSIDRQYKAGAVRGFYFMCSIIISEVYSCTGEFLSFSSSKYDFSTDKIIELLCTIDSHFNSAISLDNKRKESSQMEIEIDYRLILAFEIASELTNWFCFGEIGESDLEELSYLNSELERTLRFNITLKSIEGQEFHRSIQQLKNQLPEPNENSEQLIEWWSSEGGAWLDYFRDWIIEHRKIVYHGHFVDAALETVHGYYNINNLLVKCLNSGCEVSEELRSRIEDNLFLPIDS